MPLKMLDRLCLDPGTRTIGELFQEREWAAGEIRRLRTDAAWLARKHEVARIEEEMNHAVARALNAQRLLRLASAMIGLKRSAIYKYVSEGRLPAPIKIGIRGVRWKLAEVLAWRAKVSE